MKKRKIEDFILVVDAFGPMPMWSLQHPIKEAKDSFMIVQILDTPKKKWPQWFKRLWKVEQFCNKLSKDLMDVQAYITGVVTYSNKYREEKCKHITNLKIEFIDIRGFYPTKEEELKS